MTDFDKQIEAAMRVLDQHHGLLELLAEGDRMEIAKARMEIYRKTYVALAENERRDRKP